MFIGHFFVLSPDPIQAGKAINGLGAAKAATGRSIISIKKLVEKTVMHLHIDLECIGKITKQNYFNLSISLSLRSLEGQ